MTSPSSEEAGRRRWPRGLSAASIASPKVAAVLAVLAPLAGTWIALRRDQVLNTLRAFAPHYDTAIAGGWGDVAIFFATMFALGVGFAWHKAAEVKMTRERQAGLQQSIGALDSSVAKVDVSLKGNVDSLHKGIAKLDEQLEALATFGLTRVTDQFKNAILETYPATLSVLRDDATNEDLIKAIGIITAQINGFVRAVDAASKDVDYTSSVFLFRSYEELFAASANDSKKCSALLERDGVLGRKIHLGDNDFAGILHLRHELSGERHSHLPETFVLMVDDPRQTSTLPGAPEAAQTGKYTIYYSIEDIQDWCNDSPMLNQYGRDQVFKHYSSGPLRSFLSIPLYEPKSSQGGGPLVGVLSIEKTAEDLLSGARVDVFVALMSPVVLFLSQVLHSYRLRNPL